MESQVRHCSCSVDGVSICEPFVSPQITSKVPTMPTSLCKKLPFQRPRKRRILSTTDRISVSLQTTSATRARTTHHDLQGQTK